MSLDKLSSLRGSQSASPRRSGKRGVPAALLPIGLLVPVKKIIKIDEIPDGPWRFHGSVGPGPWKADAGWVSGGFHRPDDALSGLGQQGESIPV